MKPMLARPLDGDPDNSIRAARYALQAKVDGKRLLIDGTGPKLKAYNRHGERTDVPARLAEELGTLTRIGAIVDGEFMPDGLLQLFDLPCLAGKVAQTTRWRDRQDYLAALVKVWGAPNIRLLPTARTTAAKRALAKKIWNGGYEGYVLKDVNSPYEPGRRSGAWLKVKNVRTVDCVVMAFGEEKENIEVGLYDGTGELVPIGTCSRYEGEAPRAKLHDVIEVQFLNAGSRHKPKLYQPHAKKIRDDKAMDECDFDQLVGCWKRAEVPV